MIGLLGCELRKCFSTKLWWGLLIPVVLLSIVVNALPGLFTDRLADLESDSEATTAASLLVIASLAYTMSLTSVFAVVMGAVSAGGEFRHRTISTTYLLAGRRERVLAAKLAVSALVGAGYAVAAAVVGVLIAVPAQIEVAVAVPAQLAVAGLGVLLCALWAAFGTAVASAMGNQVGALVVLLIYLLAGELAVSVALGQAGAVAAIAAYLPGNAADIALYGGAIVATLSLVAGLRPAEEPAMRELVGLITGVASPLAWWVALLVLLAWTALFAALGALVRHRRDVT